jgi:hypothetical protein
MLLDYNVMERNRLDSFAQYMVGGALDTVSHSRQFSEEYGTPPTDMAKVHHMRSIVQARLTEDERFELDEEWADFGRVKWTDLATGQSYILRSQSALRIETEIRNQGTLFNPDQYIQTTDVVMVVYEFDRSGLNLSVAKTVQRSARGRLEAATYPRDIGSWSFTGETDDLDGAAATFDQQAQDVFDELGNLDLESGREGQ